MRPVSVSKYTKFHFKFKESISSKLKKEKKWGVGWGMESTIYTVWLDGNKVEDSFSLLVYIFSIHKSSF